LVIEYIDLQIGLSENFHKCCDFVQVDAIPAPNVVFTRYNNKFLSTEQDYIPSDTDNVSTHG